ncbi:hypothetical protein CLCR_06498 [Cladophialophora carrionii]|uniref:Uncharacterized protein n=1 Tax=Cladophialophora carrionii TaxID=86049 RepID=A0A1C1C9K2_9EURO|nr:hypothetical protein CLCR_06498 [Cladophialophora carrionii]
MNGDGRQDEEAAKASAKRIRQTCAGGTRPGKDQSMWNSSTPSNELEKLEMICVGGSGGSTRFPDRRRKVAGSTA